MATNNLIQFFSSAVFAALLLCAAVIDCRRQIIPNTICALSGLTPELLAGVAETYGRQQQKGGISLPGEYLKALLLRAPQEAALQRDLQGGKG